MYDSHEGLKKQLNHEEMSKVQYQEVRTCRMMILPYETLRLAHSLSGIMISRISVITPVYCKVLLNYDSLHFLKCCA